MFLVRSVRRRLVSLFAVALILMMALAGIGLVGLFWHQEAVDDLDFVLNRSPNRDHLSRSVAQIGEGLFAAIDLRQDASLLKVRSEFLMRLKQAEAELFEFRRRAEALPLSSAETVKRREQVELQLNKIYERFLELEALAAKFPVTVTPNSAAAVKELQLGAIEQGARIQRILDTLPPYVTTEFAKVTLEKDRRNSIRLMKILGYVSSVAALVFAAVLTCGFRWISVPVRAIARGCTRIANGDTDYRIPPVSRWQDEFSDVVAGVNCMADRFQQAEEDLQYKVRERSEQLVRSQTLANVGFLAAGVAHEINNPLSAIGMAAESLEFRLYDLLGMQSADAREAMDRVAMIRTESRRCGDITARLLDFSRGERDGRMSTDLAEVVREVMVMVQHLGQFRDRTVDFVCDRPVVAEVNAAQLKQVILNLVANALQATTSGGLVTIRLQDQVDFVVLSITDNGCGMDATTLNHVFDPFFTKRETGQGTGLGLSITHRIVEDHGGTVTPMSDGPGCGSTFQIRLPKRRRQIIAA